MKIILTNWINLLGIFLVCAFAEAIALTLTKVSNIFSALIISLMAVLGYGMMFFILLIIGLAVLDLVLIVPNQKNLKLKLIIEWLIISSPFIYWTIEYEEWIFAVGIVSFLVTQLLREKYILNRGIN